jgi:serine/threonine protein kinase
MAGALDLRRSQVVRNVTAGRWYRIEERLGEGGYGAAYRVVDVTPRKRAGGKLCLKITTEPEAWHREAYFGELLMGVKRVVEVYGSFAWYRPSYDCMLYCLTTEYAEFGDLAHYLEQHPKPWSEKRAWREISMVLRTVELLHEIGVVHRDLTPSNVLVTRNGQLKLADFGIAAQRFAGHHPPADVFDPEFVKSSVLYGGQAAWRPDDDVYQLGLLFGTLLCGKAGRVIDAPSVKQLPCSPEAKAIIQRCVGARRNRFKDAAEMLRAMQSPAQAPQRRVRVSTLVDKRVAFTGTLESMSRTEAQRRLKKAGGIYQNHVGQQTDVLVVGQTNSQNKAGRKGQKLLDVDRERELRHTVATITERRFLALSGK